jgi:hypothetical protein
MVDVETDKVVLASAPVARRARRTAKGTATIAGQEVIAVLDSEKALRSALPRLPAKTRVSDTRRPLRYRAPLLAAPPPHACASRARPRRT